jgi:YVTN family beta-propeller protein
MKRHHLCSVVLALLTTTGCEMEVNYSPTYNVPGDPPNVFVIAQVDGRRAPVKITFVPFSSDVTVRTTSPSPIQADVAGKSRASQRFGMVGEGLVYQSIALRVSSFKVVDSGWTAGNRTGWFTPPAIPPNTADAPMGMFAMDRDQGTVLALNPETGALVSTIRTGAGPGRGAVTADGTTLLVPTLSPSSLTVIDVATRNIVRTIPLPPEAAPSAVAVTPDGTMAYVSSFLPADAAVYAVDLVNRRVAATLRVGGYPQVVRLTPDGSQAWVSGFFDDAIYVFDTLTNTQIFRLNGIVNPRDLDFNPTGTRAYLTSSTEVAASVKVVDTATFQVIASIPVPNQPADLEVTPSGKHVFVTSTVTDTVAQIDTTTNTVIRTIRVGRDSIGVAFVP